MRVKFKKIIAIVLCISLVFAAATTYSTAASNVSPTSSQSSDIKETATNFMLAALCNSLDKVGSFFIKTIVKFLPDNQDMIDISEYKNENFYEGNSEFIENTSASSKWSMGYSQRVLTPTDLTENTYYMGGFAVGNKIVDKYDDIKVRAICLDDGSERGKVMFATIDAIGICNDNIREIRALLKDYAEQNNIVSINISVTHTHSGIDMQGIWGIFGEWKSNPLSAIKTFLPFVKSDASGVNKAYMQSVYRKTADALIDACNGMKQGNMYYSEKNIAQYLTERNDTVNIIDEMSRIRFVPDDGSKQTLITNFGCHPETVGLATGDNPGNIMSADFVPYMENVINKAGFNFMYIQGAIGEMITSANNLSSDGLNLNRYQRCVRYGEELGYIALGMTYTKQECIDLVVDHEREANDLATLGDNKNNYTPWYSNWQKSDEKPIEPILNIAAKEIVLKCDNPVVGLLAKLAATENLMMTNKNEKNSIYTVTEVGYLELGKFIKVLISPGETNPEFVLGGLTMTKGGSIKGKDFAYKPLNEYFDSNTKVLVFDVMNDSAGYINPDNDYALAVARYRNGVLNYNTNALLFSLTSNMGSTLISSFLELADKN